MLYQEFIGNFLLRGITIHCPVLFHHAIMVQDLPSEYPESPGFLRNFKKDGVEGFALEGFPAV
jgi:hypothetical protein